MFIRKSTRQLEKPSNVSDTSNHIVLLLFSTIQTVFFVGQLQKQI